MSAALYEQQKYEEALAWSRKALTLAPNCPAALWDYAGALDMTGHERQAIKIWRKLLDRGLDDIANGECGEGKRWAEALLNDCRYRIALSYLDLGEHAKAQPYLRDHLAQRRPGLPSWYTLAEVRVALTSLRSTTERRGNSSAR
jgi:tetratricopeptide (TPR) repeat protein